MRTLKNIGTGIKGGLEGIVGRLGQLRGQAGGINGKALLAIGLLGAAAISIGICASAYHANGNNFPEYHFNGNLDGEQIRFHENNYNEYSYVVVQEPGKIVRYVLREGSGPDDHTLELEKVAITEGDKRVALFSADSPNQDVRGFVETAKQDVDNYLNEILAAKKSLYNPQAPSTQKGDSK